MPGVRLSALLCDRDEDTLAVHPKASCLPELWEAGHDFGADHRGLTTHLASAL
jgi:hypothetical protein